MGLELSEEPTERDVFVGREMLIREEEDLVFEQKLSDAHRLALPCACERDPANLGSERAGDALDVEISHICNGSHVFAPCRPGGEGVARMASVRHPRGDGNRRRVAVRGDPPDRAKGLVMRDSFFFDLDGTLTYPFEGITGCIQNALEQLGSPVPSASSTPAGSRPTETTTPERSPGPTDTAALTNEPGPSRVQPVSGGASLSL